MTGFRLDTDKIEVTRCLVKDPPPGINVRTWSDHVQDVRAASLSADDMGNGSNEHMLSLAINIGEGVITALIVRWLQDALSKGRSNETKINGAVLPRAADELEEAVNAALGRPLDNAPFQADVSGE